jgi:predicted  nucleic acid-binding Zn-ribbon protein
MTDEKVKQLEARIDELQKKLKDLDAEASARIDALEEDLYNATKLARAVCELQEELQRKMPDLYLINKIDAPTMVGMK